MFHHVVLQDFRIEDMHLEIWHGHIVSFTSRRHAPKILAWTHNHFLPPKACSEKSGMENLSLAQPEDMLFHPFTHVDIS